MNIVVFGNVPLATWVVERIRNQFGADVLGVVCDPISRNFVHHGLKLPGLYEYARRNRIPVISLNELPEVLKGKARIVGISCRFPHILRQNVIALFDHGIVNLHGGELPRFRGVNIANHVILENVARGAGTMHYIDKGVDTGPIIDREYFEIEESDTAYDVFLKTQDALMTVFDRNVQALLSGNLHGIPQQEFLDKGESSRLYKSGDLAAFRRIPFDSDLSDILRRARAFTFPGHEPAYFMIDGHKVFVSVAYGSRAQAVLRRIENEHEKLGSDSSHSLSSLRFREKQDEM